MLTARVYAPDLGPAIHESDKPGFLYADMANGDTPVIYLPKNGRMTLHFNLQQIQAGFRALATVSAFNVSFPYINKDEMIRVTYPSGVTQTLYSQDYSVSQTPGSGALQLAELTVADSGYYGGYQEITFAETTRYGMTHTLKLAFKFCEELPALDIRSGTCAEAADGELATAGNTFNSTNGASQFFSSTFGRTANLYGAHRAILEPAAMTVRYSFEKMHEGSWVQLATDRIATYVAGPGSDVWTIGSLITNETMLSDISANGYDAAILSAYRLRISTRNKLGNLHERACRFFLDWGVDARPSVMWTYSLPTRSIPENERIAGKETEREIDFDALRETDRIIASVRVFDEKNYAAQEGFRGQPVGTGGGNLAQVCLLQKSPGGIERRISGSEITQDPAYGNKPYVRFDLTIGDFLEMEPEIGQRKIKTVPYRINRVVTGNDGVDTIYSRVVNFPANIWNLAFPMTIACRDWVGNESRYGALGAVSLEEAKDYPGNSLTLFNSAIYSPAYCPDIQLTSVTQTGGDATKPVDGDPLTVTVLPTMIEYAPACHIAVRGNGATVFENDIQTWGSAAVIAGLRYGASYAFSIIAKNGNGYESEPASDFAYVMNRENLPLNKTGVITGNETWNWRYRLIGDVLVTGTLSILPGASVEVPKHAPEIFADKRTKLIVKTGGTLVIDGSELGTLSGSVSDNYAQNDAFVNFGPSGVGVTDTAIGKENNWGGIYFEGGYGDGSRIARARIRGAYDGMMILGKAGGSGKSLSVSESIVAVNHIGIHVAGNGRVFIQHSVIAANREYGIKTENTAYSVELKDVNGFSGYRNGYAEYYSGKALQRMTYKDVENDIEACAREGGNK